MVVVVVWMVVEAAGDELVLLCVTRDFGFSLGVKMVSGWCFFLGLSLLFLCDFLSREGDLELTVGVGVWGTWGDLLGVDGAGCVLPGGDGTLGDLLGLDGAGCVLLEDLKFKVLLGLFFSDFFLFFLEEVCENDDVGVDGVVMMFCLFLFLSGAPFL